jgi:hypothetical protein
MQKKLIFGIILFHLIFVPIYSETLKSAANKSTGKKADAVSSHSNSSNSGMSLDAKAWVAVKLLKYGLKYGPKSNFLSLILGGIMGGTITYCALSGNKVYYKIERREDGSTPEKFHIKIGNSRKDATTEWIKLEGKLSIIDLNLDQEKLMND